MKEMDFQLKRSKVQFGSEIIDFDIRVTPRTTLEISVHPDLSVKVTAPTDATLDKIQERVKKRAPWIIKQKIYFAQFLPNPTPKKYVPGESFRYLGRQYRLKIEVGEQEGVKLSPGVITVSARERLASERAKTVLEAWYREKAKKFFEVRLNGCLARFNGLELPEHRLRVRKMLFCWGTCTKGGLITLNRDLIQAPSHCIDYVICHELTHLLVRNHTNEFFKILSRVMPDWESRRRRLEKVEL